MDNIFGVSLNLIMAVLVALLAVALAVVAYVALRQRIMFMIGLRNIPRRRAQTILIVLGLMLSSLIISAAFTTGDTVSRSLTSEVYNILGHVDETIQVGEIASEQEFEFDTALRGEPLPEALVAQLDDLLKDEDEIDGLMPVLAEPVAVLNPRARLSEPLAIITGVDAGRLQAFPDVVDRDGQAVELAALADDELLVNESLAEELNAEPGDTLEVFYQNRPFSFRVADIVRDSHLTGVSFPPFRKLGMVTRLDALQEAFERQGEVSFIAVSNRGGVRDGLAHSDSVTAKLSAALSGEPYTVTPVKIAVAALFTNILLSAVFLAWTNLAHGGLALATSLASMLNITVSTVMLRKKIGRMDGRRIAVSLLKIVPASIVMGVIGWWVSSQPVWSSTGETLYKAELLCGSMAVSVLFYVIVMWILRSEELSFMWGMVRRKAGSRGRGQGV